MERLRLAARTVIVPILAIAVALGVGSWASGSWGSGRGSDGRSSLNAAFDALPAGTLVAGFTDWTAIRRELDVPEGSGRVAREELAAASLKELSARSVLGGSIAAMHDVYGWSAADLDWEAYGQSRSGAAMVAKLTGSASIDQIERRLTKLGYARDGEVWTLDAEGAATVGADLASTLGKLSFVPAKRLVVAADRPAYVPDVLATIRGRDASLLSVRPAIDLASSLTGSVTAVLQAGAFGCRATSLADLGPAVQAQASAALVRAGDLEQPTFTGRGLDGGSKGATISFVSAFASPAQAARQTAVRKALATGPFIGRSGQIQDTLELKEATTRSNVAKLDFTTDPSRSAYMSGEGPLLFASCP